MINYKLAKELKDNGFPLIELAAKAVSGRDNCLFCGYPFIEIDNQWFMLPTLSELISVLGDDVYSIEQVFRSNPERKFWRASGVGGNRVLGDTPEEATAMLYLKIKAIEDAKIHTN